MREGVTHHNACDCQEAKYTMEIAAMKAENARLREALEEFARPPYRDSNLASWAEWVNARALAVIADTDFKSASQDRERSDA